MASHTELVAAFNSLTDLVVLLDNNAKVIFLNQASSNFYNIENPEEIMGSTCRLCTHAGEKVHDDCPAQQVVTRGKAVTVEKVINGEVLNYSTSPLPCDRTNAENVICCGRIITVQKRLEQELIQSEKLKGIGQLAAGVAHELNTPLCSILGFSELLKESIEKNNPGHEFIDDIIDSAKESRDIVTGLLEYARQSISTVVLQNIESSVDRAISLVRPFLTLKDINVIRKRTEDLPKIRINLQKTVQVFMNIITNAVDAMSKGGKLIIATQQEDGDCLSISFSDDGCGISEQDIDQVFDPFFTTKNEDMGTGLGLSIASEIVEQQNGTITVVSEVGEGTTFKISFPVTNKKWRTEK